jgi:hypothetical protein
MPDEGRSWTARGGWKVLAGPLSIDNGRLLDVGTSYTASAKFQISAKRSANGSREILYLVLSCREEVIFR